VNENAVACEVVDAAFKVHVSLGPGLLESVYLAVLARELERRRLRVECQKGIPVIYDGMEFDIAFRADLIVQDLVIVEIKSVEAVAPVHKAQVLTYLKFTGKKLGLLINFNVKWIKDGISRIVNGLEETR
jgi:GxxExxY protein